MSNDAAIQPVPKAAPGMTANTRIITDERDDVVRVPLKGLRFSPRGVERPDPKAQSDSDPPAHDRPGGRHKADADAGVWVLRGDRPERVAVVTGLTDGNFAEVSHGDLQPGDRVVIDEVTHEQGEAHGPNPQGAAARPHFRGF